MCCSQNQHLYFTSDDEIKEGDWYILFDKGSLSFTVKKADYNITNEFSLKPYSDDCRKIEVSTDPKLTQTYKDISPGNYPIMANVHDGLPQPSQALIEAYCKQGGFDEVDVEMEIIKASNRGTHWGIKIDPNHNTVTTHRVVEKTYTREEVEELIHKATLIDNDKFYFSKWIKENL